MNSADFAKMLDDVMNELSEHNGTFERTFGKKSPQELEELRYIAAVAMVAADRYYSNLTRMDFALRTKDEVHKPKLSENTGGSGEGGKKDD